MRSHLRIFSCIIAATTLTLLLLGLVAALAASPVLIDINPTGGSIPTAPNLPYLTVLNNNTLFLVASGGSNDFELWKSIPGGTTSMVKDISTGNDNLYPNNLAAYNGLIYLNANDSSSSGDELWVSDGTDGGTVLFKDINPTGNSNPTRLIVSGGLLFFQANNGDAVNGAELWKSDGTPGGTVMVRDIYTGTSSSFPALLTDVNGTLFFVANDGVHGPELWKSDGTPGGTVLVEDINPSPVTNHIQRLVNVGGTLFFRADDGVNGAELWKSDGTPAGTMMVKDINLGPGDSTPTDLEKYNNQVYFRANDGLHGEELWKSDGSSGGTVLVSDIVSGTNGSFPGFITAAGGNLYFAASPGASTGRELWKSDGTESGTQMVKDINPAGSSNPTLLTNIGGTLFFQANDGQNGNELWKSNGTSQTTGMIADLNPAGGSSNPDNFTLVGLNTLYFTADDGTHGRELWSLNLDNQAPVANAGGPYSGSEGSPINLTGVATDDDNQLTVLWQTSASGCTFADPSQLQTSITCMDNGNFTITMTVSDWWNASASVDTTISVSNAAPQISSLLFSANPSQINSQVIATVLFSDPGALDTHTASIDWGEGPLQNMTVDQGANTATASHTYADIGQYPVQVTVTDDDGASVQADEVMRVQEVVVPPGTLFLPLIQR